jgi:TolB protein
MHPVGVRDPFRDQETLRSIPLSLIPDAVLGDLDSIELACIYINELGTHEVWYRFLNLGIPVAASAGTDSFASYFRSFAVGATRLYVHVDGPFNMESYLSSLKQGRSFVSTGPLLKLTVNGAEPGDVVPVKSSKVSWRLTVTAPNTAETVEVLVNGEAVWATGGLVEPGMKTFEGSIEVPEGGWIAARAHGGTEQWPGGNGIPFAHTSPVWLNARGSTDPEAADHAARDLLRALEVAENRLVEGYGDTPIPKIRARFSEARRKLEGFIQEN